MAPAKTNWYDEPMTEAEREAPIKSLRLFYKRVKAFMTSDNLAAGKWPTIKYDPDAPSQQFLEWLEYFECHVEEIPVTMKEMLSRQRGKEYEFTVPTEFPKLFDPTFYHDTDWKAPAPKLYPRELREKFEELQKRYGPNWGIKQFPTAGTRKPYQSLTDEDLRKLYPRHEHDPDPPDDGIKF